MIWASPLVIPRPASFSLLPRRSPASLSATSSMAWGLLLQQPAGAAAAAAAAALGPSLVLPATRRSFSNKEQPHRFPCINQIRWKQPLRAAKSHGSRSLVGRSSSDSSAEVAAVSRPAGVASVQSDQSMMCCTESVPGSLIVISGYWTGPDVDDGCGSVEAMLQRIK